METGGFKGRTRVVGRDELYARAAAAFAIGEDAIVAEYGMTELSSQYYDSPASRWSAKRIKLPPPWLRPVVVDVAASRFPTASSARSVTSIAPTLVGRRHPDRRSGRRDARGLLLLGREEGAALRGCSLDAEDLLRR